MRIPGASVICVAPRGHHDRMMRIEAANEVRESGKSVRGDKLPRYLRFIIEIPAEERRMGSKSSDPLRAMFTVVRHD